MGAGTRQEFGRYATGMLVVSALLVTTSCGSGSNGAGGDAASPSPMAGSGPIVQSGVKSLSGVAWSGSVFLAVGNADSGATMLGSTDGVHWVGQSPPPFTLGMHEVIWDGARFVTFDKSGVYAS